MVLHGKLGRVRITASTPTSTTNLSADLWTDKRTLVIDDTTRRHWDRNSTLHRVYGATTGTPLAAASYTLDYVRGRVVFSTDHSTAVVYKVDMAWFPTSCLGVTKSWSLDVSNDLKDSTVFSCATGSIGWRTFTPGLGEGTIQLGRLYGSSESTGPPFVDRQALSSPLFVELLPSATAGDKFECYAYIQTDSHQISVDDLGQENVTLKPSGPIHYTTST